MEKKENVQTGYEVPELTKSTTTTNGVATRPGSTDSWKIVLLIIAVAIIGGFIYALVRDSKDESANNTTTTTKLTTTTRKTTTKVTTTTTKEVTTKATKSALETYVESIKSQITNMSTSLYTADIFVKDNSLVYSFKYNDSYTADQVEIMKSTLEKSLSSSEATFRTVLNDIKLKDSNAKAVIVEYLNGDGEVIYSRTFTE